MKPKAFRYFRYIEFDYNRPDISVLSNSDFGGICIGFDFDSSNETMSFAFSRCAKDIVFCPKLAKKLINNKIKNGEIFKCQYNPVFSLLDNLENYLSICKIKSLSKLRQHIKSINNHNLNQKIIFQNSTQTLHEKVKLQY